MFEFRVWLRTLLTWAGVTGAIYGIHQIILRETSVWWLVGTFVVYHISMLTISVGNHRLFSHQMFECSRFWHWFFALWGTVFGNGSSVQWAFVHIGHHIYSDTPKDPHQTNLRYFFRIRHKPIEFAIPRMKWLLRDPAHRFAHKYAMLLVFGTAIGSYLISINFFLFCYLIPAAYQLITGGLFLIYSHDKNGAVDRYWMELFFPFTGEWVHEAHHGPGGSQLQNNAHKPWHIDYGYWFMRMISK